MNKNQYIKNLTDQLFIVEGVITDILTSDTVQNLNQSYQKNAGITSVSSALLDHMGGAAVGAITASSDGIDVTVFAIEVEDNLGIKHFFKGCFPEVVFEKGEHIKVVAQPLEDENYSEALAIINTHKQHIWTGQEVVRGRLKYRLILSKSSINYALFSSIFMYVIFCFMGGIKDIFFTSKFLILHIVLFISSLITILIGWRIGASFDEQSMELEAIARKLGFHNPTMLNLGDYKQSSLAPDVKTFWRGHHYTYFLDKALEDDHKKYPKIMYE